MHTMCGAMRGMRSCSMIAIPFRDTRGDAMNDPVAEIADLGRALKPKDRAQLVDLLVESLDETIDPSVDQAWKEEIRRRVAAYERGEAKLYDADDVLAEAARIAP
jgi:putative addiction module component (TIGR02574 family)